MTGTNIEDTGTNSTRMYAAQSATPTYAPDAVAQEDTDSMITDMAPENLDAIPSDVAIQENADFTESEIPVENLDIPSPNMTTETFDDSLQNATVPTEDAPYDDTISEQSTEPEPIPDSGEIPDNEPFVPTFTVVENSSPSQEDQIASSPEPTPEPEPVAPIAPDPADANKMLSPDEIAALFASMG